MRLVGEKEPRASQYFHYITLNFSPNVAKGSKNSLNIMAPLSIESSCTEEQTGRQDKTEKCLGTPFSKLPVSSFILH